MAHKIKMETRALLDATSKAILWVAKKSVNVALQGFLIECSDGTLSISASDGMSTDISIYIDVDTNAEFKMCVPADKLHSKLTVLAKTCEEITLTFGKVLVLKCGHHISRMTPYDSDYFPRLYRDIDLSSGAIFDTLEFAHAVRLSKGAVDPKSPFPALHDIYFGDGNVVSIDGIKMSVYSGFSIDKDPVMLNGETCAKIAGAVAAIGIAAAVVNRDNNKLAVHWDSGIITATMASANKFPAYKDVMATAYETLVTVPLDEIKTAIALAIGDAAESENLVILEAHEDGLLLNASSSSGSHQSTVQYISSEGPSKRIGISVKYVNDALRKVSGTSVSIGINNEKSIVTIFGHSGYIYGIMPMYITEEG